MTTLLSTGWGLASFAKPILQLALVLLILIEAAKKLGIISDQMTLASTYNSVLQSASIQAVIAIIIVAAVSISALAGIGNTDVLKDLALVVVGFYFGSKIKDTDRDRPSDEGGTRAGPPTPVGPEESRSANSDSVRSYERTNPAPGRTAQTKAADLT